MTRYIFRREELSIFVGIGSTKLIFVGYGKLNFTTVIDFLHQASCMYACIYSLFKYAAFGCRTYFFVLTRVFAEFQQSCNLVLSNTTDILEQHSFLKQKNDHVTHIKYVF